MGYDLMICMQYVAFIQIISFLGLNYMIFESVVLNRENAPSHVSVNKFPGGSTLRTLQH